MITFEAHASSSHGNYDCTNDSNYADGGGCCCAGRIQSAEKKKRKTTTMNRLQVNFLVVVILTDADEFQ